MAEDKDALLSQLMGMLGDNPEEKISAALSALGVGEEKQEEEKQEEKKAENPMGIDMEGFMKLAGLMSELGREDHRTQLLYALKPFLSEERRPKVDSAVRLLRFAGLAEAAGKQDLLKNLKL